jgi:hypothetical protein
MSSSSPISANPSTAMTINGRPSTEKTHRQVSLSALSNFCLLPLQNHHFSHLQTHFSHLQFMSSSSPISANPSTAMTINGEDPPASFSQWTRGERELDKRRDRETNGRKRREERGERCFSIKIMYWVCTVFPYALGNTVETQWTKLNIGLLL